MENTLNKDGLFVIMDKPSFNKLSEEQKTMIINSFDPNNHNNKGVLDKMFGNNSERLPFYITFIICISLIVIAAIFTVVAYFSGKTLDLGFWEKIIPVVTLALGYLFGKSSGKE